MDSNTKCMSSVIFSVIRTSQAVKKMHTKDNFNRKCFKYIFKIYYTFIITNIFDEWFESSIFSFYVTKFSFEISKENCRRKQTSIAMCLFVFGLNILSYHRIEQHDLKLLRSFLEWLVKSMNGVLVILFFWMIIFKL